MHVFRGEAAGILTRAVLDHTHDEEISETDIERAT
jgi:hypothetical protein